MRGVNEDGDAYIFYDHSGEAVTSDEPAEVASRACFMIEENCGLCPPDGNARRDERPQACKNVR